jgi:hypothetical protein
VKPKTPRKPRNVWTIKPTPRVKESAKVYDRKKGKGTA